MNRQAYRHSRKAIGLTVAASTALAAFGVSGTAARAQTNTDATQVNTNGVSVSILSPFQASSFEGTKKIEVSAFYQSTDGGGIQTIELDIDGVKAATKDLDSPEVKGIISFLIDPSTLSSGIHKIDVRAVSSDSNEAVASTSFHYTGDTTGLAGGATADPATAGAPTLSIEGLAQNQKINGLVTIKVAVVDPSGKSPYVSLFVDNVFKTLRNYGPYTFDWDTTRVSNGMHTISVSGFSDETQIGKSEAIHVFVNNVMGDTTIQSGLTDTQIPDAPKTAKPAKPAAVSQAAPVSDALSDGSDPGSVQAPATDAALDATHGIAARSAAHMPSQLASADIGSSGIDAETILNAPFLVHKAPVTPDEIVPTTSAQMVLPGHAAPAIARPTQQMAAASMDADDLSPETLLSAPFLAPYHAASHVAQSPSAEALPPDAAPIQGRMPAIPAHMADPVSPAVQHPEVVAGIDTAGPSVAAPEYTPSAPDMPAPVQPAKMAIPTVHVHVGEAGQTFQMASASIDGGLGAAGGSTLNMPIMPRHVKAPAGHIMADSAPIAHHTVDVFSRMVTERMRGSYMIVMDDHAVKLDQPMQDHDKVLCAPLRQIFESQGGILNWSPKTKEVRAMTATHEVKIKIGSRTAMVNGESTSLKTAPYLSHSRTMIPIGFLPLALNVSVSYDSASGHLMINSRG